LTDARKGTLLSLVAALFGAVFLIPYKAAGQVAPASGVVIALLFTAAVFNTITAYGWQGCRRLPRRIELLVALALAVCTVIGNVAVLGALARLEPAIVSVVTYSQVFLVVALAWPLLGERPTSRFAAGAALAVGGFALMKSAGAGAGTVTTAGVGLALLGASMWATMQVITRSVASRIDLVLVNAFRLWLSVVVLACVPGTVTGAAAMPVEGWALAMIAALVGPFFSRVALMYAVRYITASHSTLIALAGPIFAFLLGLAVFGTAPTALEIAGGLIILAGVALPVLELMGATHR
jgi:drug/metabolite transporter (DMT)-like permease